jgi:hypothetical protein
MGYYICNPNPGMTILYNHMRREMPFARPTYSMWAHENMLRVNNGLTGLPDYNLSNGLIRTEEPFRAIPIYKPIKIDLPPKVPAFKPVPAFEFNVPAYKPVIPTFEPIRTIDTVLSGNDGFGSKKKKNDLFFPF